jgi:hypothetical protein
LKDGPISGTIAKTTVHSALDILNLLYCQFFSHFKFKIRITTAYTGTTEERQQEREREREREREKESDCMTTLMGTMSGQYMGWKLNGDGAMVEVVVLKAWWW